MRSESYDPNGTVLIVFIASDGGGDALRIELEHNKVASVETRIDDAVAAKFRYARP